jgi:hypothetical protein
MKPQSDTRKLSSHRENFNKKVARHYNPSDPLDLTGEARATITYHHERRARRQREQNLPLRHSGVLIAERVYQISLITAGWSAPWHAEAFAAVEIV